MSEQTLQSWKSTTDYDKSVSSQIFWVEVSLAPMLYTILPPWDVNEERTKLITVSATHISRSMVLPVYKFNLDTITIKLRGNFYDWCVRYWGPVEPFFKLPEYLRSCMIEGHFEGMVHEESPVAFTVTKKEQLYAILWSIVDQLKRKELNIE